MWYNKFSTILNKKAKTMKNQKNLGFTLLELLVVITIVGFISVLAIASMTSVRAKSRDSKRLTDIKQIQAALNLYYTDKRMYPRISTATNATVLGVASARQCLNTSVNGFTTLGCSGAFMADIPRDPGSNPANNRQYYYVRAAETVTGQGPQNYYLRFYLESGVGQHPKGTNYITPNGSITITAPF